MVQALNRIKGQIYMPDVGINPLRVEPPEGDMIVLKKGNKDGPLEDILLSVDGWHFWYQDKDFNPSRITEEWQRWDIVPDERVDSHGVRRRFYSPNKNLPEKMFALTWGGFGKALYIPHLRYTKWELPTGEGTTPQLVRKDKEDSPVIHWQYNMNIPVVEVESIGNIKTTVYMNVVVRIVNPYKALFLAGGWESLTDAAVHAAVRDRLSNMPVEKIRAETEGGTLVKRIIGLSEDKVSTRKGVVTVIPGLRSKFGIEIRDVRFVGFNVKTTPELEKAMMAIEVNRYNAEAAVEKAKEITTLAAAEAKAQESLAIGYTFLAAALGPEGAAEVVKMDLLRKGMGDTNLSVFSLGGSMPIAVTPSVKPPVTPPVP